MYSSASRSSSLVETPGRALSHNMSRHPRTMRPARAMASISAGDFRIITVLRSSGTDALFEVGVDLVRGLLAVDARKHALRVVVGDQGLRLPGVHGQAVAHGRLTVVVALIEGAAALVTD